MYHLMSPYHVPLLQWNHCVNGRSNMLAGRAAFLAHACHPCTGKDTAVSQTITCL
jgi:hypothetical protein